MNLARRMGRALRVRGLPIDPRRRKSMDWVRTALMTAWAIVIGAGIMAGLTNRFRSDTYRALAEAIPWPTAIGASLFAAGALGAIGWWTGTRWAAQLSGVLCAVWHGLLFGFTIPANLGQFGNTNLVGLFALLVALLYLIELIDLSKPKVTT